MWDKNKNPFWMTSLTLIFTRSVELRTHEAVISVKEATHMGFHYIISLQWCHNERSGISNHRRPDCLLNHLLRHRSKKTSKLRVTGLHEGNPPVTGGFPSQRASNKENVFVWWCHRVYIYVYYNVYIYYKYYVLSCFQLVGLWAV